MIGDVKPKSQEAKRLDAKETGGACVWQDLGDDVAALGTNITATNCEATVITGDTITALKVKRSAIFGYGITAGGGVYFILNSIIYGSDHTLTDQCFDSLIGGRGNDVKSSRSCTIGYDNINHADNCIMCGEHGETTPNSSSDAIVVGNGTNLVRRNSFRVHKDGNVYATAYNTSGADYAEYFEWADGNPDGEDRRGMLVQLVGDKITPAHGDDILGAVSARPSVCGNAYEDEWHGKYKRDVFGAFILVKDGKRQLSDEYDPDRKYIPRSQRPEWAAVGMIGRLIICDNGKCQPGGYVTARQGVGAPTFKETRARCLRRIDDNHVEILIR